MVVAAWPFVALYWGVVGVVVAAKVAVLLPFLVTVLVTVLVAPLPIAVRPHIGKVVKPIYEFVIDPEASFAQRASSYANSYMTDSSH